MAKVLRRNPNANMIGRKPTSAQKLINTTDRLGLPGIAGMQGSSVNLYDTVAIATNAGRQTLNFFSATSGKSTTWTNIPTGKLPAGGSMLLQKVTFIYILATDATFTDANVILAMTPFSGVATALMPMNLGSMSISIANQTVVSNYNIYEGNPSWNPNTTGIAANSATPMGQNSIPLEAAPTLPPDQAFSVNLSIPAITAPSFAFVMCIVGRYGSIYSSGQTL